MDLRKASVVEQKQNVVSRPSPAERSRGMTMQDMLRTELLPKLDL
jgi:hypothetical protein